MKPLDFEIFRAGSQTDSAGNTREWTVKDLDQIVESYDPKQQEAPIVVGHPKTDAPAFGWVRRLYRKGKRLFARAQLVPEMIAAVRKGLYRKRSIALYPPDAKNNPAPGRWYLRHIGFLGAAPPAVKGLEDIAFSEDPEVREFIESFSEREVYRMSITFAELKRRLFGTPDIPDDAHLDIRPDPPQDPPAAGADPRARVFSEQEVEEREKALREKLEAEFAEKQRRAEQERARAAHAKTVQAFVEERIKAGKFLPAWKELGLVAFMESLPFDTEIEFGESEKKSPWEIFRAFMESLPEVVPLKEIAGRQGDTGMSAAERINDLVNRKLRENPGMLYTEAFAEVQAEQPDLAAEYAKDLA